MKISKASKLITSYFVIALLINSCTNQTNEASVSQNKEGDMTTIIINTSHGDIKLEPELEEFQPIELNRW